MKQKTAALCVAAAFGWIATLGAQTQTATTTSQQSSVGNKAAHDVTITGCLAKGTDGRFMLTNARIDDPMSTSTTAGSATSTTAGTSTATTTGTPANKNNMPSTAMTWLLGGGSDLDKHLGHKIQVTGKTNWDASMDHGRMPATTASAGTSTTAGAPSTAGTTGSATSTGEQRRDSTDRDKEGMGANQPRLDVQSMKMIASSCS